MIYWGFLRHAPRRIDMFIHIYIPLLLVFFCLNSHCTLTLPCTWKEVFIVETVFNVFFFLSLFNSLRLIDVHMKCKESAEVFLWRHSVFHLLCYQHVHNTNVYFWLRWWVYINAKQMPSHEPLRWQYIHIYMFAVLHSHNYVFTYRPTDLSGLYQHCKLLQRKALYKHSLLLLYIRLAEFTCMSFACEYE